jgi:hypothetical protein
MGPASTLTLRQDQLPSRRLEEDVDGEREEHDEQPELLHPRRHDYQCKGDGESRSVSA